MANLTIIKDLAKKKGISLESLANELDITPQALSLMMRKNSTKVETLERIAYILKVNVSEFFEESNSGIKQHFEDNHGNNAGHDMTVNPPCTFAVTQVLDEIAAQRKLAEEAQAQNKKSQEQIDRLLAILENRLK